jgi:tetratricopeptide (TPR) repeat protein
MRARSACPSAALAVLMSLGCITPTPTERAMSLVRQHREEAGIALLEAEVRKHPLDLDADKLLIRLLAFHGDLAAAREEVARLAKRLPADDPSPWIELGHALELAHQFDEAMAAYETASTEAPASPAGPLEAGTRAARWGEWDVSRRWLEEAVRRGARSASMWHTLGLVRLNLHDAGGAREAYLEGVRADPKAVDSWLGLATAALTTNDWAGALAAYDGALRLRPAWGDGYLGRAWALARLGRAREAQQALDQAEALGADPAALGKQSARLAAPSASATP